MMRRRERGEQVPAVMASQLAEVSALTAHGAGEIFQAVVDGQVLSSILVLLSRDAGYYHSAGTSAEGMACGASHVLVHDIAMALQAASKQQFNLGGVSEPGSGLDQFKRGFGSRRVELDAVHCSTAGRLTRWIGVGVTALRQVATAGRPDEARTRTRGRTADRREHRPLAASAWRGRRCGNVVF